MHRTLLCKIELALTFAKTGAIRIVIFLQTAMAAHPLFELGTSSILGRQGATAGVTEEVPPLSKPVGQTDALIEDKAFSSPETLLLRHLFEIFKDTALEVKNLCHSLRQQVVRRFLTTDSTGTEHGDALVMETMRILLPPFGKLAEGFRARIDRTLECADLGFIVVPGVDHRDIRRGDQRIPIRRIDIMPDRSHRIDIGLPHCHDLLLETHLHAAERHGFSRALFPFKPCTTGQRPDMGQHRIDPRAMARDGAVDPLARQKQRAADTIPLAHRQQGVPQGGGIREPGKVIKGGNSQHGRGISQLDPARQEGAGTL